MGYFGQRVKQGNREIELNQGQKILRKWREKGIKETG